MARTHVGLVAALALVLSLAATQTKALQSKNNCKCTSDCSSSLEVFGLKITKDKCLIDKSACGNCPHKHTEFTGDWYRFQTEEVCYDDCTPETDSEEAKANALLDVNAWFEQEKSKFDAKFTDLHSQFKQKVEEDLTAAGDAVRKLLADPDAFKAAAVEKLEAISQDLLAHSKNLAGLTAKKLSQLATKLKDFTVANLKAFLDNSPAAELKQAMKEYACIGTWTDEQVVILAKKAGDLFGSISGWTKEEFKQMGNLVKGIAGGNFSNIKPLAFKSAALALSVTFYVPRSVSEAAITKAKDVFKEVSSWDRAVWESLGKVAVGLTQQDLAVVTKEGLEVLKRVGSWDDNQTIAIAERIVELQGKDNASLTQDDWAVIARYAKGVAKSTLQKAGDDGLKILGKLTSCDNPLIETACLEDGQLEAAIASAKSRWGDASKWTKANVETLGNTLKALTVDDVKALAKEGAIAALDTANKMRVVLMDKDQRKALADKAKEAYTAVANSSKCWIKDAADAVGAVIDQVDASEFDCVDDAATLAKLGKSRFLELLDSDHAKALKAKAVAVLGEVKAWTAAEVEKIGGLVRTLEVDDIKQLGADAIAAVAAKIDSIDQDKVDAVVARAKEVAGEVKTWGAETWVKFEKIAAPILSKDLNDMTMADLEAAAAVAKGIAAEDAAKIRSKIISLMTDGKLSAMTAEQAQKLKKLAITLAPADLKELSGEAIAGLAADLAAEAVQDQLDSVVCPDEVEECAFAEKAVGSTKQYCFSQTEAMLDRAKELGGDIANWDVDMLKKYKHLLTGMSASDIASLPDQALSVVTELKCFNNDQLKCLASRAVAIANKAKEVQAGSAEFAAMLEKEGTWKALGSLAKGLGADDLESAFNVTQLLDSAEEFARTEWSAQQASVLVGKLAEQHGADVKQWAGGLKGKLGTLVAGLDEEQLKGLGVEAFTGSAEAAAAVEGALCTSRSLHALVPAQLQALTKSLAKEISCEEEAQFFTDEQMLASFAAARAGVAGVVSETVVEVVPAGGTGSTAAGPTPQAGGSTTAAAAGNSGGNSTGDRSGSGPGGGGNVTGTGATPATTAPATTASAGDSAAAAAARHASAASLLLAAGMAALAL